MRQSIFPVIEPFTGKLWGICMEKCRLLTLMYTKAVLPQNQIQVINIYQTDVYIFLHNIFAQRTLTVYCIILCIEAKITRILYIVFPKSPIILL